MTTLGGYRVFYYEDINDQNPKVIHEPLMSNDNKLIRGKISKRKNSADEFVFSIAFNNHYYNNLNLIKGLIKVVNLFDDTIEFYGRIINIDGTMESSGSFLQEVTCESVLAYLHDMTMMWTKQKNEGVSKFFRYIIEFYNERVEEHKKFKIGKVNVENRTDLPYLYTTFETTWECINNRLIEKFGGYIVMRAEKDGNYIDYLSEVGEHKATAIELGTNIISAHKSISLTDMMTQIVPIGGDDPNYQNDEIGTSSEIITPPVHIKSVNDGFMRLEDKELMAQFGVIRKIVQWSDITTPSILKSRGLQYLKEQKVALANWKVEVVERSLIDKRFDKFELYNYHPIKNAPLSGVEELQIIGIDIDINNPQKVEVEIGADSLTISSFQLQQRAALESIEKFNQDLKTQQAKLEAEREALYKKIEELNNKLVEQQERLENSADKDTVEKNIETIQEEIEKLQKQINAGI